MKTETFGFPFVAWCGLLAAQVRHEPGRPENLRPAKPSEAWVPTLDILLSVLLIGVGTAAAACGPRK